MSEVLKKYRELKRSNPFAAAQFRKANAAALLDAEQAERPAEHVDELAEREKQASAVLAENARAQASVEPATFTKIGEKK